VSPPNKTRRLKREAGTAAKRRAVLAALAQNGNVTAACEAAKVNRSFYYDSLADESFAAAAAEALDAAADRLEEEARRRAETGIDEPVFYQGKKCGSIRRYSDTLLIFLLKAARPNKYRERTSMQIENPADVLAGLLGVKPDDLPK
jgi:hypothetical protein